jgi:hypothetical protein
MKFTERTIEEIMERMSKVEDFIAKKGVGSQYLEKAQRVQRNVNLALVAVGSLAIAGLVTWAIKRNS